MYANLNWWNNYLTGSVYNNWHRWVAQYNYQCDYNGNYDMWQCTSKAQVDGISTDVDVSFYYGDLLSDADVNTPVVEVGDTDLSAIVQIFKMMAGQTGRRTGMPWNNWKEPASGGTENPDKQRKSGSKLYRTCGWVWMD